MRLSAKEGFVKAPKRAEEITRQDENELWETSILGSDTPQQLQETLLYLIGMQ